MYTLHYAPDNASLIIRLALEEIGAPYRTVLVNRAARAQDSAAYRAIAPTGLIPALQIGDQTLFETGAILMFLAETHGALTGAPRADFLKWFFFTATTLHADMRLHFYPDRYAPEGTAAFQSATRARIAQHLALLDRAAAQTPAIFFGQTPTILALYLVTLCRWLQLYPTGAADWFDLRAYPHIFALAERIQHRPAVQRAAAAEGLGPTPLTAPQYAQPAEGSAT